MRTSIIGCALLVALSGCASTSAQRSARTDGTYLRVQLARSLVAHREFAAATVPLRQLVAERPQDAELHALLGDAYREQGLYEAAQAEYDGAIRLDPKRADAFGGRGLLRDLQGDGGEAALEDLRTAIKIDPEQPAFYNNLGFALFVRGRYPEAIAAYREGLRRSPDQHRMRNNLGLAYGRLGHFNRAKREFERGGSRAAARNNLGYAYEQSGDRASACQCYREAAQLAPSLIAVAKNVERACADPTSDDGARREP